MSQNGKHLIAAVVALLVCGGIFAHFIYHPEKYEIPYKKLTLQMPDGSNKIFIGKSAQSIHGIASWVDKHGGRHRFTGPHWLELSSKAEYIAFTSEQPVKAEKE